MRAPSAWICLVVLCASLVFFLLEPLPLQSLRNGLFDQFQRWQPRVYQDVPVKIIDLDEESLRRLGQWPWPRTQVAELVDKLRQAGVAVVVFDVLFAEADRTSPSRMLRNSSLPPAIASQLAGLPDHDLQLAASFARQPLVLGFAAEHSSSRKGLPLARFGLIISGEPPVPYLPAFQNAIRPLPVLERAASGIGALTFQPGADGVVRRVPTFVAMGQELRPSLMAEALRVYQQANQYRIHSSSAGVERIDIGQLRVPTTSTGELWVYFSHTQPARTMPAWQVLEGQGGASLKGSIALIGTSAQGLQDLRFSPLGGIIPGVEIHAQALEQVLSGDYLLRPAWAVVAEAASILFAGLLLLVLVFRTRVLISAALALGLMAGLNALAWYLFVSQQLLLDLFVPSLCLALIYGVASIVRHMATEREQRWMRAAFSRYVSPNLVSHLVANPGQLTLGGKRQVCSFVFTDLAGFTEMMERQAPEAVVSLLNDYLEQVISIAFKHEGTLDRIVGDAVAIMFSAPLPQVDHQARALACALEIHRFATAYVAELSAKGTTFGQTRIGVHSGEVVVGNFGGSTLFDYRALGDPVNTTARLESLNQYIGTSVCVSEAIRGQCADIPMRPIGLVRLVGKTAAVKVFEPLETMQATLGTRLDAPYEAAYRLMVNEDDAALTAFEQLHSQRPQDDLVAFHLQRLRSGERGEQFVMTRK